MSGKSLILPCSGFVIRYSLLGLIDAFGVSFFFQVLRGTKLPHRIDQLVKVLVVRFNRLLS